MNNFARAHNAHLDPPDPDPVCEDGCGEPLTRDRSDGEWFCDNKHCPLEFDGTAREIAGMLIERDETIKYLREQIRRLKLGLK